MEEREQHLNNQESESKSLGGIWLWFFAAMVAYVLSIGPAVGIYARTEPHSQAVRQTLEVIYMPVNALHRTKFGRPPLDWWVGLWTKALESKGK